MHSRHAGSLLLRAILLAILIVSLPVAASAQKKNRGVVTPNAGCPPEGCTFTVSVTPDGAAVERPPNTGPYTAVFTVDNAGNSAGGYTLTCKAVGGVTCVSVTPTGVSLGPDSFANVSVQYNVTTGGTLSLTAAHGTYTNSGSYNVIAVAVGPPVVTLRNHNRDNVDRSLCLTAGAGEAAAWGCGDLVITHSMPGYSTLGRDRGLTLIHNSGTAYPRPAIAAVVTQPNGVSAPITVFAELKVGPTVRTSASYSGWPSSSSPSRQIVLDFNAAGDATGAYPIELRVQNQYSGSVQETLIKDTLLIVNRFVDQYGAGFSIAGLERLYFNQPVGTALGHIFWMGGDGSAKLYRKLNATTWVAPLGGFQDTIALSGGVYTRSLRHGIKVQFNSAGRHTATINRAGHQTTFTYNTAGDRLISIEVPPACGAACTYTLAYDVNSNLDYIMDPGGRRLEATFAANDGRLTSLTDPDGFSVSFGWDADRRIISRTNRAGFTTTYQYSGGRPVGSRLSKTIAPAGAVPSDTATAVTLYDAWNDKGLAVGPTSQNGVDTSLAYTKIFGPRYWAVPSVQDTAAFRVDRWGAPTKIVNAVGATTTLVRGDALRPALVTQVTYPSGRVVNMTYTTRGNLAQVQDVNSGLPTRVTNYAYKSPVTADSPDTVRDVLNRKTKYAYNSMGLTDSIIDPRGHRTKFFYRPSTDPLKGAVDSIAERLVETWKQSDFLELTRDQVQRFSYDVMGNLKTSTGPTGLTTSYVRDSRTRVIGTYDPLGTRRGMGYDAMNQVTRDTQYTGMHANPYGLNPLAGCDATQLSCSDVTPATYVPALPAALETKYMYDPMGLDTIFDPRQVRRVFDADNRGLPRRETDEFGNSRTATYDRGGLLTSSLSRSNVTVRYRYDVVGRRTAMIFPLQDYSAGCQPAPSCAPALQVPGDSLSYSYDISGNLLSAKNQRGTNSRTYYPDGSLKRKITLLTSATPDTLMYEYDAVGALIRVVHGRDVRDTTTYRYNNANGGLDTLDFRGVGLTSNYRFLFQYDGLGRRRQVTYPNATVVTLRYDAAGTLRQVVSSHPGSPPAGANADILDFTLRQEQVSAAGLITRENMVCGGGIALGNPCGQTSPRTTTNKYNRLGMLVRQQMNLEVDSIGYDASGNMVFRREGSSATFHTFGITGSPPSNRMVTDAHFSMNYVYTPDGDRDMEYSSTSAYSTRFYYYDGLQRMTGAWNYVNVDGFLQPHNNATACLFDADGQMSKPCDNGAPSLAYDGDNVVATPIVGTNGPTWRIVHGPGTDDPLVGWWRLGNGSQQVYYWVTDGQGRHLAFADSLGWLGQTDYTIRYGQDGGKYAGGTSSASSFKADRFSTQEMPGLSFFRNRAYDQQTGRWTQEDPIGVAGGLNLYQFNGNNPVSYIDPYGLCPWCLVVAAEAVRGAVIGAVTGGLEQMALNKLSGRPTFEGVARTSAVGAGVGAVTGALGSAVRIYRAVSGARAATGFAEAEVASTAEANAAAETFAGKGSRAMVDRGSVRAVGVRNDATGASGRYVHTDKGTPRPHANLENAGGGNTHVRVNPNTTGPWF